MAKIASYAGELVDTASGIISREIFVNQDIYQQEQEQIFTRTWQFVGHESQVPNPGDYFLSQVGEESVILSRDKRGKLHVLLNSCRHRGMRVCRYDEGNTSDFLCPYHGWSYETDGKLTGVPFYRESYEGVLDRSAWGLIEAPQLTNYKGSVWVCWDPKAPSFLDYMGGMITYLDGLLDYQDGREAGAEVVAGVQKWVLPCNWKFPSENFMGDMYHAVSHTSVEKVGIGPGGPGQFRQGVDLGRSRDGITSFPALGHGARGLPPGPIEYYPFPTFKSAQGPLDNMPVVEEYFRHVYEERKKRFKGKPSTLVGGHLFPNTSYHALFPRTMAVWHPVGPSKTEGWRWLLVDRDAPKEVKDLARHHFMRYSGPAGLTEQDDMENWAYAHTASTGVLARRHPYNFQLGLGSTHPVEGTDGAVVTEATHSEENARTFYGRWAQLMDAKSWDVVVSVSPNGGDPGKGSRGSKRHGSV